MVVRQQQLRRVNACKALAVENVTTQHIPVVFEVHMKKWKEKMTMGLKGALYRIWCGVNRLGDSGVKVV